MHFPSRDLCPGSVFPFPPPPPSHKLCGREQNCFWTRSYTSINRPWFSFQCEGCVLCVFCFPPHSFPMSHNSVSWIFELITAKPTFLQLVIRNCSALVFVTSNDRGSLSGISLVVTIFWFMAQKYVIFLGQNVGFVSLYSAALATVLYECITVLCIIEYVPYVRTSFHLFPCLKNPLILLLFCFASVLSF